MYPPNDKPNYDIKRGVCIPASERPAVMIALMVFIAIGASVGGMVWLFIALGQYGWLVVFAPIVLFALWGLRGKR